MAATSLINKFVASFSKIWMERRLFQQTRNNMFSASRNTKTHHTFIGHLYITLQCFHLFTQLLNTSNHKYIADTSPIYLTDRRK